jgi:hypothetical protein
VVSALRGSPVKKSVSCRCECGQKGEMSQKGLGIHFRDIEVDLRRPPFRCLPARVRIGHLLCVLWKGQGHLPAAGVNIIPLQHEDKLLPMTEVEPQRDQL